MFEPKLYLVVQFNFPRPFKPEYGDKAKALHAALQESDWIVEVLTASGGIGGGPAGLWILGLENYGGLDRLFGGEDPASRAYQDFFSVMDEVRDSIREAVLFT